MADKKLPRQLSQYDTWDQKRLTRENSLRFLAMRKSSARILEKEAEPVPKKFSFETLEEKKLRARQKLGFPVDQTYDIDINDVVMKDDEDILEGVRRLVRAVIHSIYFKGLIFAVIAINAFHVALQTIESLAIPYSTEFFIVDNIIMGIFVCEIVLKWFSGFFVFWKNKWNVADFFIVFVLHFGPWLQFVSNVRLLRVLRIIRAFRSIKSVKTVSSLTGLSLVVETILQSLPDMANIVLLLVIFTLVLSVVGVKLFGRFVPEYFGDPVKCMFSIFVCFTQDGWVEIFQLFEPFAVQDAFTYISATLFFVVTILTAAFIIANLIVAVVATNLDRVMKEVRIDSIKKNVNLISASAKYIFSHGKERIPSEYDSEEVSLVMLDKIMETFSNVKLRLSFPVDENDVTKNQRAIYKTDFSHTTLDKLENYFMLLVALDKNLKEHKKLRKRIYQTLKIIRALNEKSEARLVNVVERRITKESHSLNSFVEIDDLGNEINR